MGGCGATLYTGEVLSYPRRWLRARLNLPGSARTPPHLLRLQWRLRRARGTSGRQARRQASTSVTSKRTDERASRTPRPPATDFMITRLCLRRPGGAPKRETDRTTVLNSVHGGAPSKEPDRTTAKSGVHGGAPSKETDRTTECSGVHGGAPRRETDHTTGLRRGGPQAGYTRE